MQLRIEYGLAGTVCEHVKSISLTLTDNVPFVQVALCEKNCITNFKDDVGVYFQVCSLDWGKDNLEKIMHERDDDDDNKKETHLCIIAGYSSCCD